MRSQSRSRPALLRALAPSVALAAIIGLATPAMGDATAVALQLGLHPHALACSGLTAREVRSMLVAMEQDALRRQRVRDAGARVSVACDRLAAARMRWQDDPGDAGRALDVMQMEAELATALMEQAQASQELLDSLLRAFPPDARNRLMASRRQGQMAIEDAQRVVPRQTREARRLQWAMRLRARAQREQSDLDPAMASFLAIVDSDQDVVRARQDRDERVVGISDVFADMGGG